MSVRAISQTAASTALAVLIGLSATTGCNVFEETGSTLVSCEAPGDCPDGQLCIDGACFLEATTEPDALDVSGGDTGAPNTRACGADACQVGETCCGDLGCVDTSSSATHCGGCGIVCGLQEACVAGTCQCGSTTCTEDQLCCDGGCINPSATPTHCGACNNVCGENQLCIDGTCVCELPGGATEGCIEGETCCGGAGCRNLASDVRHCGGCGIECGVGETCVDGTCQCGTSAACDASTICCGVGAEARCLDPMASECNCGNAQCQAGQTCCEAGNDLCNPMDGEVCEACVDSSQSEQHCGGCGIACRPGQQCRSGSCACEGSLADCDGTASNGCETDLLKATEHCGACGTACDLATPTCCGGSCSDRDVDIANCGGCGNVCPVRANSSPICTAGECGLDCEDGWGDCDGDPLNGCEVLLTSTLAHCGTCGNACPVDHQCLGGECLVSCPSNTGNCDGIADNGCEANTNQDESHCGTCGNACVAPDQCRGGVCK